MNRYRSIVNGVVEGLAVDIERHLEKVPDAEWRAEDGKLVARIKGKDYDLTFAPGDPLSEALLLLLNNKSLIISRLKNP